jgi:hypothetical protein
LSGSEEDKNVRWTVGMFVLMLFSVVVVPSDEDIFVKRLREKWGRTCEFEDS